MKILIVSVGTRGDVQPYVALGLALKASGNEVTICTSAYFEPFIREYGLDYAYCNNDLIDFMHTPEGEILLGNGSAWEILTTLLPMLPKVLRLQERQMEEIWAACKKSDPDLILYHMKTSFASDFAEKLGVPSMLAFCIPMHVPTTGFPRSSSRALVSLADLSDFKKHDNSNERENKKVA